MQHKLLSELATNGPSLPQKKQFHRFLIWENSLVKPFASMPSSPMNSTSGTFWISNEPRLYSLRTSLIILLEDRCTVMSCLLGLWLTIFAWYLARLLSGGSLTVRNGNSNASWVSPGSRRNKVALCYIKCSFFVQRQRHYSVCHSAHKHHHKHNFDTLNRRNKSVNACYNQNNVQNCIHHSS